jgi:hypothetical protein
LRDKSSFHGVDDRYVSGTPLARRRRRDDIVRRLEDRNVETKAIGPSVVSPSLASDTDPRPSNQLLPGVSVPHQPFLPFTISCADPNPFDLSHRRRHAGSCRFVNRLPATEH